MKKVYAYSVDDIVIYFCDDEIKLIAESGDAEMVENGIDLTGAEIVYIESQAEINDGVNLEDISTYQEKILSERIGKYIKDNNL